MNANACTSMLYNRVVEIWIDFHSILTAYIVAFSTFLVSSGVFCKTHLIFQSIKKIVIIKTYKSSRLVAF